MKTIISFIKNYKTLFTVFIIYLIPRILDIGNDIQNFDANLWYDRSLKFIDAIISGNFIDTYQQYHPGVTLMWIAGVPLKILSLIFENLGGITPFTYANHFWYLQFTVLFPIAIVISCTGVVIYYYMQKITNRNFALIFAILLSLEPFFLGITRFMHVTGLLAMFSFASTIVAISYLHDNKRKHLYIFSVLTALAMLTKINAIIFWGLNIGIIGLYYLTIKKDIKKAFLEPTISILTSLATYILLWPAMWVAPFDSVRRIIKNGVLKDGFTDNQDEIIKSVLGIKYLYYAEISLYRLSGLLVILLITGIIIYILKYKKVNLYFKKHKNFLVFFFIMLAYLLVYYFALSRATKLKDRYITVYIPYLVALATFTYYYLYTYVEVKWQKALIYFTFVYYLFVGWVNYPVYSFYYSELFGGAQGIYNLGYNVINRGEYYITAAKYLHKNSYAQGTNPESLRVVAYGGTKIITFRPAFMGKTVEKAGFLLDNEHADYWLTRYEHLDYVPTDYCTLEKEFGPRWPLHFPMLELYKCEGLTNTYKDKKAD